MGQQITIYDDPNEISEIKKKDGYSYATSLPAYQDNQINKEIQREIIFAAIKNGFLTLLQLSEKLKLPQSTVAGRVNDLIEANKVCYDGFVVYKNRKRKQINIK